MYHAATTWLSPKPQEALAKPSQALKTNVGDAPVGGPDRRCGASTPKSNRNRECSRSCRRLQRRDFARRTRDWKVRRSATRAVAAVRTFVRQLSWSWASILPALPRGGLACGCHTEVRTKKSVIPRAATFPHGVRSRAFTGARKQGTSPTLSQLAAQSHGRLVVVEERSLCFELWRVPLIRRS